MTIESLREYIADKEKEILALEVKHGLGVRPSWVGEEISILSFYKRDAERMLKLELEKNNATE
jgi:hypothetical protein